MYVGARNVAKSFLWDADMAFVVDRRGTGDIVTSCGGYIPFCSASFANRKNRPSSPWVPSMACGFGGNSDTRIGAEQGINSVNLSVEYANEHTEDEFLDIEVNYGAYEFVIQLLEESHNLTKRHLERAIRCKKFL